MSDCVASWQSHYALDCDLKLNSMTKLEAVKLAKTYNSEVLGDDPTLPIYLFVDDDSHRLELFAEGRAIGLAVFTINIVQSEICRNQLELGISVNAVFVLNEYRTRIDGDGFGLHSAWGLEEAINKKILTLAGSLRKFTVRTFVEAHCLSWGGYNYCKSLLEHFQGAGDFEYELTNLSNRRLKAYQCTSELDTSALEFRTKHRA